MKITSSKLIGRAIIEFVILALILSTARYFIYNKIDVMLIDELRGAVAQQSQSISQAMNGRFQQTLNELQARANLVQREVVTAGDSLDRATSNPRIGRTRGILRRNNTPVAGLPLPDDLFEKIKRTFDGNNAIDYIHGSGLVFAVPFEYNGRACIFYEYYTDEAVQKFFKISSFNGTSTLLFQKDAEDWIFLSEGKYPEVARREVEYFNRTLTEMENSPVTAGKSNTCYDEELGLNLGFFFFRACISEADNMYLTGYVEWDDIVGALNYVYDMMDALFWILLILAVMAVGYLLRSRQAKLLENEKILADSANQAKSDFLSNMSHEIRTPINAVIGMNEMILRESKEPATLEYAHNLRHAATNLLELINDILDFSKIEAGKMEIIPVEYQLSSMLNDLVNMIQKRAESKGLIFEVEADENIPSVLFGDEIRIKQVITNILTNAVKYTEKGSVTLKVNSIPIDDKSIYLCISVTDTGIGIKPEDIKKLYSAFERIEEKRNRKIEGTGLGMNITNKLLTMMGANLMVNSVYGQGSNFSFQIVQQVMNPEAIGDFREHYKRSLSNKQEYHESFTAPDAKILVVDDTIMNLTVIKGLLKQTKIQIDTALNGAECLKMVQKTKYDIIFIDHMMPGMDGIETLKAMKVLDNNLNQDTPIISLTANAISGAREKYIEAGFHDYLTKPINSVKLEELIVKLLPEDKVAAPSEEVETTVEVAQDTSLPEWLRNVSGLDVKAGIEHCGNEEAYLDVLEVFANSIETAAKEIQGYYDGEDWKNYTTKVHALKSTARVIGAQELSNKAKRQEDAGRSEYVEEIKLNHAALMELYLSYAEKLKPLIKVEDDAANKPLIDEAELEEAFEAMKDFAKSFDYDSMQFIFQSLDEYRLPEDKEKIYKQIKIAADKLDWQKITELLDGKI